jgi:uncharacterized protein with PQ loop repeat
MASAELVGVPAAVASTAIGIPQLYRLLVRRDPSGVSVLTWSLTVCSGATWVAHNLRHGETVAAVANAWSALTAAGIVYRCYLDRWHRPFASSVTALVGVCAADAVAIAVAPDALGWIAAGIGMVMFVPQAWRVLSSVDSAGVSVWTWCLAIVASLLWGAYGVLHDDPAVVAPPVLTGSLALVIVLRVRYQRRRVGDRSSASE